MNSLFLAFKKKYGASMRSGKTAAKEERRVPIIIVVFGWLNAIELPNIRARDESAITIISNTKWLRKARGIERRGLPILTARAAPTKA